jgi:hypothetical protein
MIEFSMSRIHPGFAWCAIVLPEMVESVPGASVMSGNVSLGGTRKIGESKWMES